MVVKTKRRTLFSTTMTLALLPGDSPLALLLIYARNLAHQPRELLDIALGSNVVYHLVNPIHMRAVESLLTEYSLQIIQVLNASTECHNPTVFGDIAQNVRILL